MRGIAGVLAAMLVVASCTASDEPLGVAGLVAELEAEGATVAMLTSPCAPDESVSGTEYLVCINGYEAHVFEYPTEQARRAEADDAPPTQQGDVDLFWGTLGWWASSNVLTRFHYDPTRPGSVVRMLDAVMGQQIGRTGFALGNPPDEIPLSELCS